VVLALVAVFVLQRRKQRAWAGPGTDTEALPEFPVNDVVGLRITAAADAIELERRDGVWQVSPRYGYPADFADISRLLRSVAELRAAQEPKVGESQYGRLGLLPPDAESGAEEAGTDVEFLDADGKVLASVRLGKEHKREADDSMGGGWANGRYLLLPSQGRVILVTETFSSVVTTPKDWLDKEFFKVGDMKSASLVRGGETIWAVARETKGGDMVLQGLGEDEKPDSAKLRSVANAFSWASFDDVADPALSADETGMADPAVFTAEDFDGVRYTVRIGHKTEDGKYYLGAAAEYVGPEAREPAEDETDEDAKTKDDEFAKKLQETRDTVDGINRRLADWVYIVTSSTVDPVLKDRAELLEKPDEEEDNEPEAAAGTDDTMQILDLDE
jgi:hypothetical protein